MFALFEFTHLASIDMLLVAIPESLGLLASGVGLVMIAVSIRRFIARNIEAEVTK